MMLKGDYYTIAEAAEFIASKTGKKKNNQDVLLDAKKGEICLCTWFDGTLYKFNQDIKGTGKLQSIDDYKFSGYIQIPKTRITPEGGMIQFGSITIIEVVDIWAKNRDPRTLDDNELSDRYFDSQYNSYLPYNLFADLEKALIPEKDLKDYIDAHKAERSLINNESSASTSKAGAMGDAIIGCLRSNKYDPLRLPPYKNGFAGVKADIRTKLSVNERSFNQVWQKLLDEKLISYIPE
ncbi:MAG: hypothetical protein Q8M57_07095 [Nitrosomonas sp.]|uniref:hypothetical protein n=1 Tax=Nitrosomonas sp. TaxID=42353 RepID=UPI0027339459|nr:hypothetical protein [Nitrosomonas sp.]MDP3280796.1 hypothetical protein [Nitrosomonas sp.]